MISILSSLDLPDTARPLFSIIVPIFENTHCILYHLHNLLVQTEKRCEFIYGFDGENPRILQQFRDFAPLDPRVQIINKGKPATIGDLLNSCLDAASGENIIILHAEDTLFDHNELAELALEVEKNPKIDYCYYINRLNETLEDDEPAPHQQIPHRISELDEEFYPEETLYYLYKRSTIQQHKLRFAPTNSPHLHEEFSNNYAQHVPAFTCKHNTLTSTFDPFTFPPAMLDVEFGC